MGQDYQFGKNYHLDFNDIEAQYFKHDYIDYWDHVPVTVPPPVIDSLDFGNFPPGIVITGIGLTLVELDAPSGYYLEKNIIFRTFQVQLWIDADVIYTSNRIPNGCINQNVITPGAVAYQPNIINENFSVGLVRNLYPMYFAVPDNAQVQIKIDNTNYNPANAAWWVGRVVGHFIPPYT